MKKVVIIYRDEDFPRIQHAEGFFRNQLPVDRLKEMHPDYPPAKAIIKKAEALGRKGPFWIALVRNEYLLYVTDDVSENELYKILVKLQSPSDLLPGEPDLTLPLA